MGSDPSVDPWIPPWIPGSPFPPLAIPDLRQPLAFPRAELRNSHAPAPAGILDPQGRESPREFTDSRGRGSQRLRDPSGNLRGVGTGTARAHPAPPRPFPFPSPHPDPASPTQVFGRNAASRNPAPKNPFSPSQSLPPDPDPSAPFPAVPGGSQENWLRRRLSHPMLPFPRAIPSLRERLPGNRCSLPPASQSSPFPLARRAGNQNPPGFINSAALPSPGSAAWNCGSRYPRKKKKREKKRMNSLFFSKEKVEGAGGGGWRRE